MKKKVILFFCFLVSGCESVEPLRVYEGGAKSKAETAELQVYNFCPYKLDGKMLNLGCEKTYLKSFLFEVEPGTHKLEVIYNAKSSSAGLIVEIVEQHFSGRVFSTDLNAKAGLSYFISPDLYGLTLECEGVSIKEKGRR